MGRLVWADKGQRSEGTCLVHPRYLLYFPMCDQEENDKNIGPLVTISNQTDKEGGQVYDGSICSVEPK